MNKVQTKSVDYRAVQQSSMKWGEVQLRSIHGLPTPSPLNRYLSILTRSYFVEGVSVKKR